MAWKAALPIPRRIFPQRGIERRTSRYHTDKILRLSQDLPLVVEVVEDSERVERVLPRLDEMIGGGLITLEKVRVILYRAHK
jgi:PII-like signaling protein